MTGSIAGKGFVSQISDFLNNNYAAGEFYNSTQLYTTLHRNYVYLATRNNAIEATGDVSITGNLSVTGTTPTASSITVGSTSSSSLHFPLLTNGTGSKTPDIDTGTLVYRPSANQLGVGEGVGTVGQLPNGAINASVYYKAGAFLAFTEGHDSLLPTGHQAKAGDIIVDNGVAHKKDIDNVICFGALSNVADQKAVIGVYTQDSNLIPIALRIPNENQQAGEDSQILDPDLAYLLDDYQQVRVNSLGEGQINVCGQAGDIEAGDLIVTSHMAGKGMKQSDDIERSITVAKARESATFSSNTEVQQIACIYLCG